MRHAPNPVTPTSSVGICTIVAKNYLAYARALTRSLRQRHPDIPVYVLLIDDVNGYFDPQLEEFTLVTLDELALPRPREFCFRYEIMELSTAVKPFLLQRLFERGHRKLLFLDPDIWVFQPLDPVLERLGEADVILTPHLTAPLDDDRRPGERDILLSGAYNLGFLGLRRSPEVDALLGWWAERCEEECLVDPARGLFVDQRWMDLAPALLDRVDVLRDPAYNVAYWNLSHRKLEGPSEDPAVDGSPLRFFHFSGLDPLRPTRLSRHEDRFTRIDDEPLLGMVRRYSATLLELGYEASIRWPYTHATFEDGHPIGKQMRELFRQQPPGRFPDPFRSAGEDSFVHWATTPMMGTAPLAARLLGAWKQGETTAPNWRRRVASWLARRQEGNGGPPLAPIAHQILDRRPDLRQAFSDLPKRFDHVRFLRWLAQDGVVQHQLKPAWCLAWLGHLREARVAPRLIAYYDSHPEVRARFPLAFVEEHDATDFRDWVVDHPEEVGLRGEALSQVHVFFQERPSRRVREIYESRSDVQRAFPRALADDASFLAWLRESGRSEYGISEDSVLWFGRAREEHPCPRIHALYAERPEWQDLHPAGLLTLGHKRFLSWLKEGAAAREGLDLSHLDTLCPERTLTMREEIQDLHRREARLSRRFPQAFHRAAETRRLLDWLRREGGEELRLDPDWPSRLDKASRFRQSEGALVAGYLRTESGMGELGRATARALAAAAYPIATLTLDEAPQRQADMTFRQEGGGDDALPFTILHVNAPETRRFEKLLASRHAHGPVIGYWAWELGRLPEEWNAAFGHFDEVWTCSRHAADALAAAAPIPVQTVWPSLTDLAPSRLRLPDLGLDDETFTFLFLCDLLSEIERKNPLGLIRAFRRAFRGDDRVRLVIKTTGGAMRPEEMAGLEDQAGDGVVVLDRYLDRRDVLGLIAACDSYVSLHRAEGFGFTLAEAMALGKPVVATYYSGNVDFMTPWNSFPVPYRLVEIDEPRGPYAKGALWADPDLEHAADILRAVYRDRERARDVARRGRADVERQLSPAACGERIVERLRRLAVS